MRMRQIGSKQKLASVGSTQLGENHIPLPDCVKTLSVILNNTGYPCRNSSARHLDTSFDASALSDQYLTTEALQLNLRPH